MTIFFKVQAPGNDSLPNKGKYSFKININVFKGHEIANSSIVTMLCIRNVQYRFFLFPEI